MHYLSQFLTDFAHSKIEQDYIALALHVYVLKMTIYWSDIHVLIRSKKSPIKTLLVILVKLIRLADIVFLQEVFYNIVPTFINTWVLSVSCFVKRACKPWSVSRLFEWTYFNMRIDIKIRTLSEYVIFMTHTYVPSQKYC